MTLRGLKVLVIEDEPDARELIKEALTQSEADVFTAASAAEGLEILKNRRPDVLISDIGMPEEDGYQFVRAVRSLPATQEAGPRYRADCIRSFHRPHQSVARRISTAFIQTGGIARVDRDGWKPDRVER